MSKTNSAAIRAMHISRILTIASDKYCNSNQYANLMLAIPESVVEWEIEYRAYCAQFNDPEYEVNYDVAMVKAAITRAFQFPLGFIKG